MLTQAQRMLYFREFAKARAARETLIGHKLTTAEADTFRYQLHAEACAPASSSEFGNAHLDRVLGVFWSWSFPTDIALQGRQLEQPITRYRYCIEYALDQIIAILDSSQLNTEADPYRPGKPREGFLLFMLRRLSNQNTLYIEDFAETHWRALLAQVHKRYDQVYRKTRGQTRTPRQGRPDQRKANHGTGRTRPAPPLSTDLPAAAHAAVGEDDWL
jgi:hypothetical protein